MKKKLRIEVCIDTNCYKKGARAVAETLDSLISKNNLSAKAELAGVFCTGKCGAGVCVGIGEEFYSVTPEDVKEFFESIILPKI